MRVGLISDTHGLVRLQALDALAGSDLIVHAGDIGGPEVLEALRAIAPLVAIRGNNDTAPWARTLDEILTVACGPARLHVLHDVKTLSIDPVAERVSVVVAGHSHKPGHRVDRGVHFVNPGSAGPRRFKLPVSVARLTIAPHDIGVEMVTLDV
jgi:putative phosphoesterase